MHKPNRPYKFADTRFWIGLLALALGLLWTDGGAGAFWLTLILYSSGWAILPSDEDRQRQLLRSYAQKLALSATTEEEMLRAERLRQFIEG